MEYKFKYRRLGDFFWTTLTIIGHVLEVEEDKQINPSTKTVDIILQKPTGKLVVYFKDGSLQAIPKWSDCELKLGQDWKLATKLDMEKQTGQNIPLNN